MGDKTTYELNIKKKSNVRLFKYEIFDYLIKNNIFKPNQGIQTIQEFVNILNPNNDYNIFHYILLSNGEDDTSENKFKKFVKVINFFKKSNNNSSVLTLLERKDKIGNLPLYYIIYQGNIPLYHIYETLFQKNINRCLGYKNRSNLTILNMCENDIEKVMNNLNSNYKFTTEYLRKTNTKTLKMEFVEYKDLKTYKGSNPKIKNIVKITSLQTNFFNTLDNFISMHLSKQDYYTADQIIQIITSRYSKPQHQPNQPQQQANQVQPQPQPNQPQPNQPQPPAAQPQAKQVQQPPAASLSSSSSSTTIPAASLSSSATQTPTKIDTIQNSQSEPYKPVSYKYGDDDDYYDRERLIGDDYEYDDDDNNNDDDNGYNSRVTPMVYDYNNFGPKNIFSYSGEMPMEGENGNGYIDEMPMEQDNNYSNVKSQINNHRSNSSLSRSLSKSGVSKFVPLYKLTSEQNQNPNPDQNPNPNIPQSTQSMMLQQTKTDSTNPLSKSETKTQFSIKSKEFKPPKLDRNIWDTPPTTTQTDKPAQITPPVTSKSAFNPLSISFKPGKSQTDKPGAATDPKKN